MLDIKRIRENLEDIKKAMVTVRKKKLSQAVTLLYLQVLREQDRSLQEICH